MRSGMSCPLCGCMDFYIQETEKSKNRYIRGKHQYETTCKSCGCGSIGGWFKDRSEAKGDAIRVWDELYCKK